MSLTIRCFVIFDDNGNVADPELGCGLFLTNSVPYLGYGSMYDKTGFGPDHVDMSNRIIDTHFGIDDPAVFFPITALDDGLLGSFPVTDEQKTAGAIAVIGTAPATSALDTLDYTDEQSVAQGGYTLTKLADGKVLFAGGIGGYGDVCQRYLPASNHWSTTASMAVKREQHAAVLLVSGHVLVSGGQTLGTTVATAEQYDPVSRTWANTGSMTHPRYGHVLVLLADGKVLAIGGSDDSTGLDTSEIFDPATGLWAATTGTMSQAYTGHSAWLLPDDSVLVAGGGVTFDSNVEKYIPATGLWLTVSGMSNARCYFASCVIDGKPYVFGGYKRSAFVPIAACEVYDYITDMWTLLAPLPVARQNTSAVNIGTQVAVFGGTEIDIYDTFNDVWRTSSVTLPDVPYQGDHSVAITTPAGAVVSLVPMPFNDEGGPYPAVLFGMDSIYFGSHEPTWLIRTIFEDDNSNQFWAWRIVDGGGVRWNGYTMPTIENYCGVDGSPVSPVPTVVNIGQGLFIATPSSSDIATGVRGWLKTGAGSFISGDLGTSDGRLKGQAFESLPLGGGSPSPSVVIAFTVVSNNFLLTVTFAENVVATYPLATAGNYAASGLTITSAAILSATVVRLVLAVEPINGSSHTLTMVAGTAIGVVHGDYGDATPVAFTGVSAIPTVVNVVASSPTTMQVIFSKPVRQVNASNTDDALHAANYTFTGLTVGTIRGISPTEVEVTTSTQSAIPYAWAISLVADLAGNPVTPATGSVDGYVAPVVPYGIFIFLTPHTVQVTLSVSVKVNAILLQPDAWAFIPRIPSTKQIYVESVSPVTTPLTTVIVLNLRDEASVSGRYDLRITGLTDYADNLVEVTI